jgi:hypothetical protein
VERKPVYTGWAAALSTAAELARRSFDVTLTYGNTPTVDILGAAASGDPFKIQVKGITHRNAFFVQKRFFEMPTQENLYLVVVLVPGKDPEAHFRFFVLTHAEAKECFERMPKIKRDGTPLKEGFDGLTWGAIKPHEGRWDKFSGSR